MDTVQIRVHWTHTRIFNRTSHLFTPTQFEDQFFDYLFKSAKTRNSRHKSMAEFKQKAAELKGDLKMENADSANKLENIAKCKSSFWELFEFWQSETTANLAVI